MLESRKGVRLNAHVIKQREGEIELVIDARSDMPIGRMLHGLLRMESGFTQLAKEPLRFQFNVYYPVRIAVQRTLGGMGIGAGLLGVPRLLLFLYKGKEPISFKDLDFVTVWPYFLSFLLLLACIYLALRIWLNALRESER